MTNLLFAHGWATDNRVWEDTIKSLDGYASRNVNLPGHGGKRRWATADLEPAVLEISDNLAALEDGSVVGVGWSLGADSLIASFERNRAKFKGLVLVGATPCFVEREDFPWGQSKALVKRMILDMKKDAAATLSRFYALNFTEKESRTEAAKDFIERYKYPGPVVCSTDVPGCYPEFRYDEITTALEALYKMDLRPLLKSITVPVLFIHGSLDTITPVGAARYLASTMRVSNLEVFEGAGHAPFLTEPEKFNSMLNQFLSIL